MLRRIQHVHFVGIGGSGMSGIAEVLLNLGYTVSGSDLKLSPTTGHLQALGAKVFEGHAAGHVQGAHVVVTSTAVRPTNPELTEARRLGVPVIPRAEMLAELMRLKYGVAVAGSHGKTTTTSMVALVLDKGGLDPTVVVGGRLGVLGSGARLGKGEFLVAEADESDRSFLKLSPTLAVVTNIDREHLDAYRDLRDVQEAFLGFVNKVPFYGCAVMCLDDAPVEAILPRVERRVVTYGLTPRASVSARDLELRPTGSSYTATHGGRPLGPITVAVPGAHNVTNSLAAVAVGLDLELPFEAIQRGLQSFSGVDRRFQVRGEAGGVLVIDDYGHHPTEILATLETLRRRAGARRTRRAVPAAPLHADAGAVGRVHERVRRRRRAAARRHLRGIRGRDPGRERRGAGARDRGAGTPGRGLGGRSARGHRAPGAGRARGRRGADARSRQRVDRGRGAAPEASRMTRRGLPVGPPPEELRELSLGPEREPEFERALDPPADESPFLRPRRRTPLRPRRRGFSGRALVMLQVAAVGLLGVVGAWTAWQRVFASDRLRVGKLEVRGSHFLSEGEVRELVGPAVGESILALDIEGLKARLRASPWVADATVTRALPDTVRVEIRERVPLALAELDQLYLMDQDGGLIDIYGPRTGAFDLPIVRGLLGVEEASRRERARRAGALLADLGELGGELSEVFVLPSGDLRVVLRGAGEVLLFAEPPYRSRLVTFLSLRRELALKAPDAEHFDLRFRGRIFAKQPKPTTTPSEPGRAPSHPAAENKKEVAAPRAAEPAPQRAASVAGFTPERQPR